MKLYIQYQTFSTIYLVTLLNLLFLTSNSQSIFPPVSYEQKPKIEARKTENKILIDGKLTEQAWMQCPTATNFLQSYPTEKAKASYETVVRVLYDDENIYIGAICQNPGNKILVQILLHQILY